MAMVRYTDEPGSPAWHARRARCYNAGDASAAMGCHPSGKTRTQLLHELHTGLEREFSDFVQEKVINPGHRIEALWRPIAEAILGEDLQVIAGSLDVGLSRPLGASLDAITFMEDVLGECKSANDALRAALPHEGRASHERNDARQLPKGYRVQLEQQQLVTGATRTLFSACQFNEAGEVTEERHAFYTSDPALRAEILAGWKQFDADLAAYVPPPASSVEKIVAEPVEALPAVSVIVEGALVVRDNFADFQKRLLHFLEHRLIREPKTDQEFANLDAQIKEMKAAEVALQRAEDQMLAQIQSVDQAKKTKEMLAKLVRDNRLMAEKLLAGEKERRKGELVAEAIHQLKAHIDALNARLGRPYMPATASAADFGGAIKGLKTIASMEDKLATALANAKIAANEIADRIDANLKHLRDHAGEFKHLFPDAAAIVLKAPDDLQALVSSRIAQHKDAEERRLEAERARIRAEEEARAAAKLRQEQEAREAEERRQRQQQNAMALQEIQGIQQQVAIATLGRAGVRKGGTIECIHETLAETEAWKIDVDHFGALTGAAQAAKDKAVAEIRQLLVDAEARAQRQSDHDRINEEGARRLLAEAERVAALPAANVHPLPTKAPAAPASPPTLKLGEINARIAPLSIDAAGLAALGFPHSGTDRAAKLYHEHQFHDICAAITQHVVAVANGQKAVA